jgi:hypothetical protein
MSKSLLEPQRYHKNFLKAADVSQSTSHLLSGLIEALRPATRPRHPQQHDIRLKEDYPRSPRLGFNKKARLMTQPSAEEILNTGKEFGLVVAGAGFEPATFGLCVPLQLSLPG